MGPGLLPGVLFHGTPEPRQPRNAGSGDLTPAACQQALCLVSFLIRVAPIPAPGIGLVRPRGENRNGGKSLWRTFDPDASGFPGREPTPPGSWSSATPLADPQPALHAYRHPVHRPPGAFCHGAGSAQRLSSLQRSLWAHCLGAGFWHDDRRISHGRADGPRGMPAGAHARGRLVVGGHRRRWPWQARVCNSGSPSSGKARANAAPTPEA